ncbi:MAG: patatin-like phospholipase family protein [Firmicutes bacterium]|jgi:NTE family protein|nr:patatin-like phospholipase family protein [Bacillota bacterium]
MNGLVLEGGGAKGAFQIGAFMAFKEMGIDFDYIVGTSIGAINGAFFASGNFDVAYDLWYNLNPAMVLDGPENILDSVFSEDIGQDTFNKVVQYGRDIFEKKGLDISPLKELLRDNIDESKLRNSGVDYGLVTVSLSDITPLEIFIKDIPEGKLVDYIIASANLPVFKFERINGKYFLDGGFYNNLPVDMITGKNIDNIYVVRIQGVGITRSSKDANENIILIEPSEKTGRVLEFSKNRARKNISLGYYDTMRALRNLKGKHYYIERDLDENFYLDYILSLDVASYGELISHMGYEGTPYHRGLFELIIPQIATILDMGISYGYGEIILGMYEEMAKDLEFERFQIYKESEFMERVEEKYRDTYEGIDFLDIVPKKYFGLEKFRGKYDKHIMSRIFRGFVSP